MKKAILVAVLCLSLTVGAFALDYSVRVSGGVSLLFGGDYNAAVKGENDYFNAVPLAVVNTQFSKLNLGLDFGAEFILQFTDSMGVGLGAGYVRASSDSTLAAHYGMIGVSTNFKPTVSVIPVTLSFHYFLPLSSSLKLHFFAGPGLYITSTTFDETMVGTLGPVEEVNMTFALTGDSKVVFGGQGGVGLELGLSRNVALLLDVAGRYLNISSVSGPATLDGHIGIIPIHVSANATLYYFEHVMGGNYYGDLEVNNIVPTEPNTREASISLSGVQFQAGVRIHF
jgi:hypothetical protein